MKWRYPIGVVLGLFAVAQNPPSGGSAELLGTLIGFVLIAVGLPVLYGWVQERGKEKSQDAAEMAE